MKQEDLSFGMESQQKAKRKKKRLIQKATGLGIAAAVIIISIPNLVRADMIDNTQTDSILRDYEQPTTQAFEEQTGSESEEEQTGTTPEEVLEEAAPVKVFAPKILANKFNSTNELYTENQVLFMDMTDGMILADSKLTDKMNTQDVIKYLTALTILEECNLNDLVTVKNVDKMPAGTIRKLGLKAGDEVAVKDLLTSYLLMDAEDARLALINHVASTEMKFVAKINTTARKLKMGTLNIVNANGAYHKIQQVSTYDLYVCMYHLMQQDWFMDALSLSKYTFTYSNAKGTDKRLTVINKNINDASKVFLQEGYQYLGQLTHLSDKDGNSQIVFAKDDANHYYMLYLGKVNSLRNITEESERVFLTLDGQDYYDNVITITPTPIPTATPVPTATPIPTATPVPTATPIPTVTPVPQKGNLPTESNNARYQYIMGTDYKAYTMGKGPVGFRNASEAVKNMTSITVPVWKINSKGVKYKSTQTILIHKKLASTVKSIFNDIYALDIKFPIKTLLGYGYRKVGGVGLVNSTLMSAHSFGCAIDINPGDYDNDYYLGKGNDLRNKSNPYCIPDEVIQIFESYGWYWGGNFEICSDTMHFQYLGLDFLTYQGHNNFRELKYSKKNPMSGADVKNLQQRLVKLGYKVYINGVYDSTTEAQIKKLQKKYKLDETGVMNYKTWETIINLTHDMSYVF